jgi:hypothetical protein
MSTQRSDKAYEQWRDASEKFDYFMTGLTGALVAYLGQSLHPSRLGLNVPSLEVLAVATLVTSAVLGFRRIETNVTLLRGQAKRLYGEEARGAMLEAATKGAGFNASTGDVFSPRQLIERAEVHRKGVENLRLSLDELAARAGAYYQWRNRTLLLGFSLLVAARILPAYFG